MSDLNELLSVIAEHVELVAEHVLGTYGAVKDQQIMDSIVTNIKRGLLYIEESVSFSEDWVPLMVLLVSLKSM